VHAENTRHPVRSCWSGSRDCFNAEIHQPVHEQFAGRENIPPAGPHVEKRDFTCSAASSGNKHAGRYCRCAKAAQDRILPVQLRVSMLHGRGLRRRKLRSVYYLL
jgi:hypothetical protein